VSGECQSRSLDAHGQRFVAVERDDLRTAARPTTCAINVSARAPTVTTLTELVTVVVTVGAC